MLRATSFEQNQAVRAPPHTAGPNLHERELPAMSLGLVRRDRCDTHPRVAQRPPRSSTMRPQYGKAVDNDDASLPSTLAAELGDAVVEQLVNKWYSGADLAATRAAVGLSIHELTSVLRIDLDNYKAREAGTKDVQAHLVAELIAMSTFVAELTRQLAAAVPADGTVALDAVTDQAAFESAFPTARTRRDEISFPMALQHNAVGRVACELHRQGRAVEVRRGDRRADLLVRRRAAGLAGKEAARLFGLNEKTYLEGEQGKKPLNRVLAELQAVEDFIAAAVTTVRVVDFGNVKVVLMADGDVRLQNPLGAAAVTLRDQQPYPISVHHAVAGRAAEVLRAAGHDVRVIYPAR